MCRRCLYCYQPLAENETDFHTRCSKKIFGTGRVPELPYKQEDIESLALEVIRSQTTLTGVQPKLSLDVTSRGRQPARFTIVGLWGRYILKPQTAAYSHLPELEDLTMHLADLARIAVVPHSLIRFTGGELCYITKRIDRTEEGGKIRMEDFCQLSGRLTEDKYKGSHERIAKLIVEYSSSPLLDLVNYWEQVLFAWITGNADMHLKNYSLYAPDGENFVLTPAYDLLPTALVMPEDNEELALSLCGKKRKLSRRNFIEAMTQSGLSAKVCDNLIAKFKNLRQPWLGCISSSFLPQDLQDKYNQLIDSRLKALE